MKQECFSAHHLKFGNKSRGILMLSVGLSSLFGLIYIYIDRSVDSYRYTYACS